MNSKWALTVLIGCCAAGVTYAQSNPSQGRSAKMDRHFSYTDTNGNGVIEHQEAARFPVLVKHFHLIDSNEDKKISKDEMQAYRMGRSAKRAAKAARASDAPATHDSTLTKAQTADSESAPRKNF